MSATLTSEISVVLLAVILGCIYVCQSQGIAHPLQHKRSITGNQGTILYNIVTKI